VPCVRVSGLRSQTTRASQVLGCGALAAQLIIFNSPQERGIPTLASAPQDGGR